MKEESKIIADKDNRRAKNDVSFGVKAVLDQALQSYERLPMLEIVFEKFSQYLSTSLRQLTSEPIEVEISDFESLRFGKYFEKIPMATPITVFKSIEWENLGLLIFNYSFISSFIDVLLGGKKNIIHNAKRDISKGLTAIEHGIIRHISDLILSCLCSAFETISATSFVFERLETNPNFATITRPGDAIILLNIKIFIEKHMVSFDLLIPYKTINPIKEQLQQVFFGDRYGNDTLWEEMMFDAVHKVDIPIEAVIVNKFTNLSEVANLKIGDTILMNHEVDEDVILRSGDVSLCKGKIGKIENQVAVNVTSMLKD